MLVFLPGHTVPHIIPPSEIQNDCARKHLYRTFTRPDARERAQQRSVIVILVAAIEQHGYHLPVDVDNVLVEHVTEEAARRSEGRILTAPMIHYGFNKHNMGFPGTITVRGYVFIDFCYDVAHSFVRLGFDRIVFVKGYGSNQMLRNLAARRINNTTRALADERGALGLGEGSCGSAARIPVSRRHGSRPRIRDVSFLYVLRSCH